MQTLKDYRPTEYDRSGVGSRGREDWLVLPVIQTRDSGPFEASNFAAALEIMGGESETVEVLRFGHWGPGWFEIIAIAPSRRAEGEAIEARLESYPLLDEEDCSSRELEAAGESWEFWGEKEFRSELAKAFRDWLSEWTPELPGVSREDYVDAIDDIELEGVAPSWVEYCETGNDGANFRFSDMVKATDLDRLFDSVDALIFADRRNKDVTKLCALIGLANLAGEAIAKGAFTVSAIKALGGAA